jgi:hypothetical protein
VQFRLRYRAHDLELPPGEFVVGRSEECQLALDDPLVSRRHAVLRVGTRGVTIVDLGSRNGVTVNGEKITNERRLRHGDKVTIGGQEMVLSEVTSEEGISVGRTLSQTLGDISLADVHRALAAGVADEPTQTTNIPHAVDTAAIRRELGMGRELGLGRQPGASPPVTGELGASTSPPPKRESQPKIVATFKLLSGMADKALAMGRAEEAERILGPVLHEVLEAQRKKLVDAALADQAIGYAVRLAGLTQRGSWIDYVFEMHLSANRLVAAPVVDDLHGVVRRVKSVNLRIIRDYLAAMKAISASFTPNERFVLQRIEGIEQVSALK